jgi:hypothetical protein
MIEFTIESENSSDHWSYIDPAGKNVLDLGCGRWCSREGSWDNLDPNEFSPIWLANKGAKILIGVDASINEIDIFNELTKNNTKTDFVFIHQIISSPEQIKDLLIKYNIDIIKCDIEGAESNFYSFNTDDLKNVTTFAIEYHSEDIKNAFIIKLSEWGFTIVSHGKLWNSGLGVLFAKKLN